MNKIKILLVVILVSSTSLLRGGFASAAPGPFTCSTDFYQVISGQLELLDPLTGNYTDIGSNAGFDYNAIGYNVLDNYIYGIITSGANTGDLIRVANDGSTTDLGLPVGLPRNGYVNGSFDLAGNMYIRTGNHTIYEIDVSSMVATAITTSGDNIVDGNDNVYINGYLYLLVGDNLSVVNMNTDTVTTGTVSGPSGWLSGGPDFGAGWTDQAGELFFSNNESGSIYQITNPTSPSPTAVFKVAGTVTSSNDGTSCNLAAPSPFVAPTATDDSYTTAFNTALNETADPLISNDIGSALTVTSNTNPSNGTVTVNSDGTFIYTPDSNFSGTDSFNYTVTDSYGRTASATASITVSPASSGGGSGGSTGGSSSSSTQSSSKSIPKAPDTGYGLARILNPWLLLGMTFLVSSSLMFVGFGLTKSKKSVSK